MKLKKIRWFCAFALFLFIQLKAQDSLNLAYVLKGESKGDGFGVVEGLGDVNGDGYPDFAVGAPDSEYVKIYFGSSQIDTANYLRIQIRGKGYHSNFGGCIAGKGDLNNDGINDFIIANPYYGDYATGALYIYFGGSSLDSSPEYEIYGNRLNSIFGNSVSINGDINGDGYDDILVGAPAYYSDFYIYYGGEVINTSPGIHIVEEDHDDWLGGSVDIIGDLNNDGKDEFLVGAPHSIVTESGKAYLFYGGNHRTIGYENSIKFVGSEGLRQFGKWVAGLGDINNDGFIDFSIMDLNQLNIYLGNMDNNYESPLIMKSDEQIEFESFRNITSGGDLNRDGYSDFLLSWENQPELLTGKLEIYMGASEFSLIPSITISGENEYSYLGFSSAFLGDINNDGYEEIAVSEIDQFSSLANKGYGQTFIYSTSIILNAENDRPIINNFFLCQNYPNPFNPETKVNYQLPVNGFVTIKVYDMLGKEVATLVNEQKESGIYNASFNGSSLASGVYVYTIQVETLSENGKNFYASKKMLLMK